MFGYLFLAAGILGIFMAVTGIRNFSRMSKAMAVIVIAIGVMMTIVGFVSAYCFGAFGEPTPR